MSDTADNPRLGRTLVGAVPTLLVLAAIGAAGWWGHSHGWTVPKFSTLTGPPAAADDWCRDHSVKESECVECHPDLLPKPKPRGACKPHELSECVTCNPDLAQVAAAAVPADDLDRARRSLAFAPRPKNL